MKSLPIIERVHGALQLQPMTVADLAVALWVTTHTIRCALTLMAQEGLVKCAGTVHRSNGAPRKIWRLR